ncbi:MAG: hypothetical protein JNN20_00385 [Betaproteobacteria bacterium]|nr:hypothetical protein [Betaproteobacteria bacterium]
MSKWLYAMYLLSTTRGKITTQELAERLRVTYKCAWRVRDKLTAATNGQFSISRDIHGTSPNFTALLNAFVFAAGNSVAS